MGRRRYNRSRRRSNDFGYRQSWITGKGRLGRDSILVVFLLAIVLLLFVTLKFAQVFD